MKYNVFILGVFLFALASVSGKSEKKDVKDKTVSASVTSTTGAGKN
jgi:hypothetical protein